MTHPGMYRSDIDGLRGVAVLGVLFNHFQFSFLPGGFTGVDVFFVISGFLITRLIADACRSNTFSFRTFYTRRFRRIMPALLVMIAVTLAAGWFILTQSEYLALARSATAASLGFSNFYFLEHTDYFDQAAHMLPLLHTWSLGVEEQFYAAWPLVLVFCFSREKWRPAVPIILGLAVIVGFAYAALATLDDAKRAFYFPHLRAWELALGATMVFLPALRGAVASESLAGIGAGMIAVSFLFITAKEPFPGLNAGYACLGASLLIWPRERQAAFSRLLSSKVLVQVGLISYSLYLWHWPILVFYRHATAEAVPDQLTAWVLIAVSLAVAWLSWKFIEVPFRRPSAQNRFLTASTLTALLAGTVSATVAIRNARGVPSRLSPEAVAFAVAANDRSSKRQQCHRTDTNRLLLSTSCTFGAVNVPPAVAIWGDSHGVEIGQVIGEQLRERGKALTSITYSGCPPALGFISKLQKHCTQHNDEVLAFLLANSAIRTVILATYYNYHANVDRDALEAGMERAVRALANAGRAVILVAPFPEPGYSVPLAAAKRVMIGRPIDLKLTVADHLLKQAQATAFLARLQRIKGVTLIDPSHTLCGKQTCPLLVDGKPILFDDNHLSLFGARLFAETIAIDTILSPVQK